MWIKNNDLIINSDDIRAIFIEKFTIVAMFKDGSEVCIGKFNTLKHCREIFHSVCAPLLTKSGDDGVIITDDKPKEVKKDATHKSNKRSNSKS